MSSDKSLGQAPNTTPAPIPTNKTPKLKDSCDMCAASKVRCDKRKPLCGRCQKLGYPCFFSPARRSGRGHAHRQSAIANANANTNANANVNGNANAEAVAPHEGSTRTSTVAGVSNPSLNHPHGEAAGTRRDSISTSTSTSVSNSNSYLSEENGSFNFSMSNTIGAGSEMHMHRRCLPSTTPQGSSDSIPPALSRTPSFAREMAVNEASSSQFRNALTSGTTLLPATGGAAAAEADTNPDHSRSDLADCIGVAMNTLLQLEVAKVKLQNGEPVGGAIQTVTSAFRTLSSVLVCPCSENHDVGLLAASVCLAMLDVYSAIISHSKSRSTAQRHIQPPTPIPESSCLLMSMEDEFSYWAINNDDSGEGSNSSSTNNTGSGSSSSASTSPDEDATIVRVLGELTKLARVVLQFTERCSDRNGEGKHPPRTPAFLKALAGLLRSHLKSVTMNAII